MFRKKGMTLAALLLAVLLLVTEAGPSIAQTLWGGSEVRQTMTLARKKKKKNHTATPAPTQTPAPSGKPSRQTEKVAPAATATPAMTATPVPEGPIIDPQSIADYLYAHGELPENFITKQEARALGWNGLHNYVSDVAPGMSIGGDRFGNYEELLPVVKGRHYFEADCYYEGGRRNAFRIIYSDDGHVWYTEDHYRTFTELFPTVPAMTSAP